MSKVWAMTGGIACGKSTVGNLLMERGWKIIDSDAIAHRLMEPGQENWQKIVDVFGQNVLKQNQTINRRVLGDLVFHDSQLREKLNATTHPAIRRVWQEELTRFVQQEPDQSVVVIIPLLFEKGLQGEFSRIISVGCSLPTQEQRLRERGLDEDQRLARLSSQWPIADKLKLAQIAIWNEGSLQTLAQQVDYLAPAGRE